VPAADVHFESGTPVSEAKRRFWVHTVEFLAGQLIAAGVDQPPLVLESFLRQAAAAVVAVFPNTTMTVAHVAGPGRVDRAVVRRATAFIDAHADEPLTLARIAAATGVGPRVLQEAFRRHLDTTPPAYLRRVRLERVHREMLAGDPPDGSAVDAIARRWGFADPGRFAAHYRAAYGAPPHRTRHA
jgi:transcriptional regulator GlxA family with amidase domain